MLYPIEVSGRQRLEAWGCRLKQTQAWTILDLLRSICLAIANDSIRRSPCRLSSRLYSELYPEITQASCTRHLSSFGSFFMGRGV